MAWLDPDTVLASVAALRGLEAGRRTFFTWDVETGELRGVSSVSGGAFYDVAQMALND